MVADEGGDGGGGGGRGGRRRVPDVVGVWPATASSAAKAAGKVLGWIARGVFAVVPNRIDMMAPQ